MAERPRLPLLLQAILQQIKYREPPVPTWPWTLILEEDGEEGQEDGGGLG